MVKKKQINDNDSQKREDAGVFDDAENDKLSETPTDSDSATATAAAAPASSKRQRLDNEKSTSPVEQENTVLIDIDEANSTTTSTAAAAAAVAPSAVSKSNNNDDNNNKNKNSSNSADRVAGLSKFVRRILDPNRKPLGLVEPPAVIPLNDEFLQAFGQREKEYDQQTGIDRNEVIDTEPIDDSQDDVVDVDNSSNKNSQQEETKHEPIAERKVKFVNLKYTTPMELLQEECLNFGPLEEVNMIMDSTDPDGTINTGRAYVTFQNAKDAQNCVDQQCGGAVDGRSVRVSMANARTATPGGGGGSGKTRNARDEKRYWQKDVSTKCFRCGQVGHMAADCTNDAKATICPLCALPDQHDMRSCPLNRICFNCGIPGHINRECPIPRGSQPQRQVCSICCGSGHNRFQCPRSDPSTWASIQRDAICSVCGEKGHFQCTDLKWFFGLEGVFCYNCGGKGHVGNQCNRPNLNDLGRNDEWAQKEIERAEEYKVCVFF